MTGTARTAPPPGWDGLLEPGGTILWQGQPVPRPFGPDWSPGQTLFGLVFAGFGIFWMRLTGDMDLDSAPPIFRAFPLFGLLPLGLWAAAIRPLWVGQLMRRTRYTLNDRRAFIAVDDPLSGRKLDNPPLTADAPLRLIDGTPGSLQSATRRVYVGDRNEPRTPQSFRDRQVAFWQIVEARGGGGFGMMQKLQARTRGTCD